MRVFSPNFCWVLGRGVFVCALLSSCLGATQEHACDLSKQLDFRIVGDLEGEWRNEWGNVEFSFDAEGQMFGERFGCAHRKHSVVVGDYNTFDGGFGYGKEWLVKAELEPGSFALSYKEGRGKNFPVAVARGEILAPGKMRYSFISDYILHRWRPGDEEPTGTTMTGTSEGADVSSTGATSDSEETTTSDTGAEADSGTEGSGF